MNVHNSDEADRFIQASSIHMCLFKDIEITVSADFLKNQLRKVDCLERHSNVGSL
jgi:hypothetical protein